VIAQCRWSGGSSTSVAHFEPRALGTGAVRSGDRKSYAEGTPYFEVYASSPGEYDTKRYPTFIQQSGAEHNAREYSRDGRAYVVEHVGADGKRSKVAVFRNGRKVRQS
jgi:hypothetical protein